MKKKSLAILTILLIILYLVCLPVFANDAISITQGTKREAASLLDANKDPQEVKTPDLAEGIDITRPETTITGEKTANQEKPSTNLNTTNDTNLQIAKSSADLPKAGLSPVITITLVGIIILAAVLYTKVVKYNI